MAEYNLRLLKTLSVFYVKNVKFSTKEKKVYNSIFKELYTTTIDNIYSKISETKTNIDIILLDINKQTQLDIISQLNTLNIPIILLTDSEDDSFIIEAFNKGIRSYLKKPLFVNKVVLEVEKIITEYKNQEKLKQLTQKLLQTNQKYKKDLEELIALQKGCIYKKNLYEKIIDKYLISIITDSKGKILSFTKKLTYLLGYKDEIIGDDIDSLLDTTNSITKSFQKLMLEAIYKKTSIIRMCNLLTKDKKKTISFEVFLTFEYSEESQLVDRFYFYFDLEF